MLSYGKGEQNIFKQRFIRLYLHRTHYILNTSDDISENSVHGQQRALTKFTDVHTTGMFVIIKQRGLSLSLGKFF